MGDTETRQKVHLVQWQEILMNQKQGGLGIRDLRVTNQCMLLKWW